MTAGPREVRAPRGTTLTAKSWQTEAPMRMLMNNLDPEVAERPNDLVVYGGTGKAARNWDAFDAIIAALKDLNTDETLLIQSGKPIAVWKTNPWAPRVLIANSNLVGDWATWPEFRKLEAEGLIMYGQMTAGSWIYIATQGILQGTFETFGAIARIYRQQHDALTPRQEARLDAFIKRYVDRTRASRDYTQQHRPHSADPRVVNGFRPRLKEMIYQIVIGRSKGSHLWDLDGNEYVDALNGFGMSLFGWQPDFVLDAVRRQLDLGYEIGPQHPLAGPVTELVCEMTGFDRAALCNTGSEAVMGTVRIARTVTGRERIAVFAGSYHGIFDEVIVRLGARGRAMPAAPGIMPNTAANVVILEYGEPDALQWVRDNADNLAAVLVEPVQSRRPDLQPREFLHELRRITAESGSLLIFDEVVTGFRTGPGGAQAHFDVRADLASYGKVIGGGFPIGIIAGKRQYMDALDGGAWQYGDDSIPTVGVTYFAGTFVRHPLALAACHAVLSYLKEAGPELQRKLTETTTKLADSLNAFCQEHGAPIAVKHFASVWRIVFTEDHPYQDLLFAMMRSRGIHILDNFPCFMTTAHSEADVEAIRKAFCDSVLELQADGFLPGKPVQNAADVSASFDPTKPPVPGARLGRDAQGKAAWFIADPDRPGSYMQLKTSV